MRIQKAIYLVLAVLMIFSCREPFEPEITPDESRILVVEGYLDTEGIPSQLTLSRTIALGSVGAGQAELAANIRLLADGGEEYILEEKGDGVYVFSQDIPEDQEYVLEILLADGQRYLSNKLKPILTPPILDAGYVRDEEGIEVFVNTQGDANADDFLWTYEETWIFRSRVQTTYIYDADIDNVRTRTDEEQINLCYKSVLNSDILLETSSRFEDQVVFRQTVAEIPIGDERMQERYSILISQKAIDQEAVSFWETLKRNTDDIGNLFSPLPSLISGNLYNVDNPDQPVIGQVSLGVVQQTRVFIDRPDILPWTLTSDEFDDCFVSEEAVMGTMGGNGGYATEFGSGGVVPVRGLQEGTTIVGYYTSSKRCTDCTLYGDSTKPDFWED